MESRKVACLFAAGIIGLGITAAATGADARPRAIVVQAVDPELQRKVSYADLNLAVRPDQKVLKRRIHRTASDLCIDLNGVWDTGPCRSDAVNSTRGQVAMAIDRAKRQMAGLAVGPPIAISMVIGVR